jgi:hypothetical protein
MIRAEIYFATEYLNWKKHKIVNQIWLISQNIHSRSVQC